MADVFEAICKASMGIYSCLSDEISKMIFRMRLLFSLTGDYKSISYIVRSTPELQQQLDSFVSSFAGECVIVYGAGTRGRLFLDICNNKVEIIAFCDTDEAKQGTLLNGFPIISMLEMKGKYEDRSIVISPMDYKEILADLLKMGFTEDRIHILSHFLEKNSNSQYFDETVPISRGGRFVDAGAYDFETARRFMKWSEYEYDRIIAFEPNKEQYSLCVEKASGFRDIVVYSCGLWNENGEISFICDKTSPYYSRVTKERLGQSEQISVVKLDYVLDGERVDFIKMDIEGSELNALKGAEFTIKAYHPKLAISVYHNPEDIIEIPQYILSLNSDYKLYLRHYSTSHFDTVLYAV